MWGGWKPSSDSRGFERRWVWRGSQLSQSRGYGVDRLEAARIRGFWREPEGDPNDTESPHVDIVKGGTVRHLRIAGRNWFLRRGMADRAVDPERERTGYQKC